MSLFVDLEDLLFALVHLREATWTSADYGVRPADEIDLAEWSRRVGIVLDRYDKVKEKIRS